MHDKSGFSLQKKVRFLTPGLVEFPLYIMIRNHRNRLKQQERLRLVGVARSGRNTQGIFGNIFHGF